MNKAPGGAPATRQSPREFVRGVWTELRRVTWPTRDEWVSATILTVILVVAIGLYTYVCDLIFARIFAAIHPQ